MCTLDSEVGSACKVTMLDIFLHTSESVLMGAAAVSGRSAYFPSMGEKNTDKTSGTNLRKDFARWPLMGKVIWIGATQLWIRV